jgi:hypothetical protein
MDAFLLGACPAGWARCARGGHFVPCDRFAWSSRWSARSFIREPERAPHEVQYMSRSDRCPRRALSFLTLEEVFGEEEDVGGAFGEAAHEVGVPLRSEGNVDADAEALGGEFALEVAADAVEHLELEGGFGEVVLGDEAGELVDDGFVVGGNAAEDGATQGGADVGDEVLHQLDVVGVDSGLFGEGVFGAFFVGAFAEADADALVEKALGVGFGAVEVGLEDGAYAALQVRESVDAFGELEGGFGERSAFHVDADEGVSVGGVLDHLGDDLLGERGREVHAHLGELDADVGVEVVGFDGVEELVVDGGGGAGGGLSGDALAEGVERDGDAFAVELLGGEEGLSDGHAGDEAVRELAADGGALGEGAKATILGQGDEERTQQRWDLWR